MNDSKNRVSPISLAREALDHRRMKRFGSVAFNEAAEDLRTLGGAAALEAIEYVVERDLQSGTIDDSRRQGSHLGIGGLLVTYFAIVRACPEQTDRAVRFAQSLRGFLVEDAIQAIWTVWLANEDSRETPKGIVDWVVHISEASSADSSAAKRFLRRYQERQASTGNER